MKNQDPQTLPGDSKDYDLITRAIQAIPENKNGMTCEIGLRQGGGTRFIMDALAKSSLPFKVHVAVDPYGNIVYARKEGVDRRMDYTNHMRDESLGYIYQYAMKVGINFVFINLEDTEFFNRYSDGVPVYSDNKHLLSEYIFVHFDGPHQLHLIVNEFVWFNERMTTGSTIVFDDVSGYDHDTVEKDILKAGWNLLEKTPRKASYQKL
ncbi:MAG: class I SAM-dependent methyltransferase [Nitrosomonadaceae bacterium]